VNDTEQANIRRFHVFNDGRLGEAEMFASGLRSDAAPGRPDGMKTDESGNVWCSGPGGIWIYTPSGALFGTVHTPEVVSNLARGARTSALSSSVRRVQFTRCGQRCELTASLT